ncbi:MAG TPA: hypothetical protein PLE74_01905 [Candidatus Cloacimonadota bacterium]|nr:hypothetical protein [Candidatus Cloacimonadota bacterium]HPT71020.1 hypothetical protein [Candidatus Cloacimonadota bacterium]
MKKNSLLLLVFLVLATMPLLALSVHDIQYTTNAGDGTYPSPYAGQSVTLNNVVVIAKGYSGAAYTSTRWFVSDPEGGPWSGLYIYDTANAGTIQVGDLINVSGAISEYLGYTEMGPLTSVEIISHGNPIPDPINVATSIFTHANLVEQYEGCLVQVQNVRVTAAPSATYYEWYVTDGSGAAQIDDGFIVGNAGLTPTPYINETFVRIRGIVDYGHNEYAINPRFLPDILQSITLSSAQISIPLLNPTTTDFNIPIITTTLIPTFNVKKFSFDLQYDPIKIEILGGDYANSMADDHNIIDFSIVADSVHDNILHISYESSDSLVTDAETDTLIFLKARVRTLGTSPLTISNFIFNGTTHISASNVTSGSVNITAKKKTAYLNIYNPSYASDINYRLNHFNPREGKIRIDFGGKPKSGNVSFKAFLRIYDDQGRLVVTLKNEIVSTATGISSVDWDGRDSEMRFVPIGLYYCHLEVVDRATGDKMTAIQPIVVGTPLKSK